MADDEIRIDTGMDGDLEAALARLERRIAMVEDTMGDLRREARRTGAAAKQGLEQAADAADDVESSARTAAPAVRELGNEAVKTGAKAKAGATGLDAFHRKLEQTAKKSQGLSGIMAAYKWAAMVSGAFALAGGLAAIGAGAGIAIGGMAPMVTTLAAVPGLMLAVKLSMLATKLASAQLEPALTRIKNQFTELGPTIARGGLSSGVNYFANSLTGLAKVTGKGLAGLGAELGATAREAGNVAKSRPFLNQISTIFAGLRPVVAALTRSALLLGTAFVNVVQAALPITQEMAFVIQDMAAAINRWTAANLANGRLTQWIQQGYVIFTRSIGVLVDFLKGLFNILRIGAGYSSQMGTSIESAALKFRLWTESAEGQARITKYFEDSLPALREMGRLLGFVVGGLGSLGANQNVAPLLAQINNELVPAFAGVVNGLTGTGGLASSLITVATEFLKLWSATDFSALTQLGQAIAGVISGLNWMIQNVPGVHALVIGLSYAFLGWKVIGVLLGPISKGLAAFLWLRAAITMTGELTVAQRILGGTIIPAMTNAAKVIGGALLTSIKAVGLALKAAFVTSPIGWIVLAIVAVVAGIVLLWNKCAWFRDAVKAVWAAIAGFFVDAWNWMRETAVSAWNAVVEFFRAAGRWIVSSITWVRDRIVEAWSAVRGFFISVWTSITTAFQNFVRFIVDLALTIWDNGLKQTVDFIVDGFKIAFSVVKFIVQTAVYIIVGIISLIAITAEALWKIIAFGATWLWETVILPVFNAMKWGWQTVSDLFVGAWNIATGLISATWNWLTNTIVGTWNMLVGLLSAAWNAFYTGVIQPVIMFISAAWNALVAGISAGWTILTGLLSMAWNWFYTNAILPVITAISIGWNGLVNGISIAWNWVTGIIGTAWNWVSGIAQGVMDTVRTKWNEFTTALMKLFQPVGDGIKSIWGGIEKAATIAADVVKGAWNAVVSVLKGVWNAIAGAWNAIPSITVPDFVPGIGGKTFGLPKLPMLYAGGPTPGGPAIVGEHGPELLVRGGRIAGLLGAHGPELVPHLPRGGYVVPNLGTLAAGLANRVPATVAATVARESGRGAGGDPELRAAVRELAAAVRANGRPAPTVYGGEDTRAAVLDALRQHEREQKARKAYDYTAGWQ